MKSGRDLPRDPLPTSTRDFQFPPNEFAWRFALVTAFTEEELARTKGDRSFEKSSDKASRREPLPVYDHLLSLRDSVADPEAKWSHLHLMITNISWTTHTRSKVCRQVHLL